MLIDKLYCFSKMYMIVCLGIQTALTQRTVAKPPSEQVGYLGRMMLVDCHRWNIS